MEKRKKEVVAVEGVVVEEQVLRWMIRRLRIHWPLRMMWMLSFLKIFKVALLNTKLEINLSNLKWESISLCILLCLFKVEVECGVVEEAARFAAAAADEDDTPPGVAVVEVEDEEWCCC